MDDMYITNLDPELFIGQEKGDMNVLPFSRQHIEVDISQLEEEDTDIVQNDTVDGFQNTKPFFSTPVITLDNIDEWDMSKKFSYISKRIEGDDKISPKIKELELENKDLVQ
jgi:hypothetical protein